MPDLGTGTVVLPGHSTLLSARRKTAENRYENHNPIGSMYAIYGNIYHQYTPNVSVYTIHGSYGNVYNVYIIGKSSINNHFP